MFSTSFGFPQWRNPDWCQKLGFPHQGNQYLLAHMHIFGYTKYVHICVHIWISPMEKSVFVAPVWISPLHKSKQVPNIRISPLEKSIYKCIYAHIWIPKKANPNMCIHICVYGFLQWRTPYFWHQFGFLQWRNPNWPKHIDLSVREINICMHICIYLGNPNMCIYACIYGFPRWRNSYYWYQFIFPPWGNTDFCQQNMMESKCLGSRFQRNESLESRIQKIKSLGSRFQIIKSLESGFRTIKSPESRFQALKSLESRFQELKSMESRFQELKSLES